MKAFDVANGYLYVVFPLEIRPSMNFEEVKQQLAQNQIPFTEEERYNLFQFITLFKIRFDNKIFHLELYFDKTILQAISFDFVCDEGYEISFEQWVADVTNNETEFIWGRIKADEHPKYNVPLISISYHVS